MDMKKTTQVSSNQTIEIGAVIIVEDEASIQVAIHTVEIMENKMRRIMGNSLARRKESRMT